MTSITRTLPIISKASPYLALLTSGYLYNQYDKREINSKELQKAHDALKHLDTLALSPSTKQSILQSHLTNIQSSGVTVIRSVLTRNEAKQWDDTIQHQISKNDGTCVKPGAKGRIHCQLQNQQGYNEDINRLYNSIIQLSNKSIHASKITLNDIAQEYFRQHNIQKYELTQLQLLNAMPNSTHQIWHRDNINPGLTILIALRDVGVNGPTELILRSHDGMDLMVNDMPRILLASIHACDAVCYDSRVLHRGRGYGNSSDSDVVFGDRPVLVLRWDAIDTPAPGTRLIGTQWNNLEGMFLAFVCAILDWFG